LKQVILSRSLLEFVCLSEYGKLCRPRWRSGIY